MQWLINKYICQTNPIQNIGLFILRMQFPKYFHITYNLDISLQYLTASIKYQ